METKLERLVAACQSRTCDDVRRILGERDAAQFDINAHGADTGVTPLCAAARRGHVDTCEVLVAAGADPDGADEYEETPLGIAIASGHYDAVVALVGAGADVNHWSSGLTPLSVAARGINAPIFMYILEHGADVNGTNDDDGTALHALAGSHCAMDREFSREFTRALCARGADPNTHDRYGRTPFDLALARWNASRAGFELVRCGATPQMSNGVFTVSTVMSMHADRELSVADAHREWLESLPETSVARQRALAAQPGRNVKSAAKRN